MRRHTLLLVVPFIVAEPLAYAEPIPGPAMRADFGLFSPIGSIGIVYSRPIHTYSAIEIGAGYGFSGVLFSAMPKLRLGNDHTSFTPGVGVSVGLPLIGEPRIHSGHPTGDLDMPGAPVTMAWLDADLVGIEHRTESGYVLSANAGVTMALTEGHWDAVELGDTIHRYDTLPQFRLGVGKEF